MKERIFIIGTTNEVDQKRIRPIDVNNQIPDCASL